MNNNYLMLAVISKVKVYWSMILFTLFIYVVLAYFSYTPEYAPWVVLTLFSLCLGFEIGSYRTKRLRSAKSD